MFVVAPQTGSTYKETMRKGSLGNEQSYRHHCCNGVFVVAPQTCRTYKETMRKGSLGNEQSYRPKHVKAACAPSDLLQGALCCWRRLYLMWQMESDQQFTRQYTSCSLVRHTHYVLCINLLYIMYYVLCIMYYV